MFSVTHPLTVKDLHFIYSDNHVSCALVMEKSRVDPVNIIIVLQLKLIAALIGAKLAVMICHELEYDLNHVVLWTDVTVVLCYMQNMST